MVTSSQNQLLEALSNRLLRQHSPALWRKVFLGGNHETVRFEQRQLTLLYTDAPGHDWTPCELDSFARRFGGWSELADSSHAMLAFGDAADAVRAAMLLQRIGADTKVRSTLMIDHATVAIFEVDGEFCRTLLPGDDSRARAAVRRAAPGSVFVSPEAYPLLEPLIEAEAGSALVATEFDADEVAHASITLLPHASAAMSTFAGLGLS